MYRYITLSVSMTLTNSRLLMWNDKKCSEMTKDLQLEDSYKRWEGKTTTIDIGHYDKTT